MRNETHTRPIGRIATVTAAAGIALAVAFGGQAEPAGAGNRAQRRPSHAAYVQRADQICHASQDQIDAIVESLGFSPSDEAARRAAGRIVRVSRQEVRELRSLTPPRSDGPQVQKIYDAVDTAFDRIDAQPSRLFDEPGPFARATRLADAYGLDVCGRG